MSEKGYSTNVSNDCPRIDRRVVNYFWTGHVAIDLDAIINRDRFKHIFGCVIFSNHGFHLTPCQISVAGVVDVALIVRSILIATELDITIDNICSFEVSFSHTSINSPEKLVHCRGESKTLSPL